MAEKFAKNTNPANYNATPATRVDGEPSALEVDVNGNLKTTSADKDANGKLPVTLSSADNISHGVNVVTTAGTDVALGASTPCKKITIQAQTDNTGVIAVGSSGVDATIATGTGVLLSPGDVFELEIDNLADVYIDATVSGDGVRYTYFS